MFQSPTASESSADSGPSVSPLSTHSEFALPSDIPPRHQPRGITSNDTGSSLAGQLHAPYSLASSSAPPSSTSGTRRSPVTKVSSRGCAPQRHYDPSEVFDFLEAKSSTAAPNRGDRGGMRRRSTSASSSAAASQSIGALPHHSRFSDTGLVQEANVFDSERSLPLNLSAIAHGDTLMNVPASPESVITRILNMQRDAARGASKRSASTHSAVGSCAAGVPGKSKEVLWNEHVENVHRLRGASLARQAQEIEFMRLFRKMARERREREEKERIAHAAAQSRGKRGAPLSQGGARTELPPQGLRSSAASRPRDIHAGRLTIGDIQGYFDVPVFQKQLQMLPVPGKIGVIPSDSRLDSQFARATARFQ